MSKKEALTQSSIDSDYSEEKLIYLIIKKSEEEITPNNSLTQDQESFRKAVFGEKR